MKMQDDRTPEQMETHRCLIVGTDRRMSNWGLATGGVSYCGWACTPEDEHKVDHWVRARSDLLRVRSVSPDYRPSGVGHCHIYVVVEGHHPAL